MKIVRRRLAFAMGTLIALVALPGLAQAQATACSVDYNGDTLRNAVDVGAFFGFFGAGNTLADLNADNAVDGFDVSTLAAYFGFPVCPWRVDYQYNRSIDSVDAVFFQFLLGAGNLRADLNNDGVANAVDFGLFTAAFGSTY